MCVWFLSTEEEPGGVGGVSRSKRVTSEMFKEEVNMQDIKDDIMFIPNFFAGGRKTMEKRS